MRIFFPSLMKSNWFGSILYRPLNVILVFKRKCISLREKNLILSNIILFEVKFSRLNIYFSDRMKW